MIKNIIIGILVLVSIASLTFAFVQKDEAEKQKALAELNARTAMEAQRHAEQAMKEAERQRMLAEVALFEVQKKQADLVDQKKK
jgi:Flp pilus assembly protein TadB